MQSQFAFIFSETSQLQKQHLVFCFFLGGFLYYVSLNIFLLKYVLSRKFAIGLRFSEEKKNGRKRPVSVEFY